MRPLNVEDRCHRAVLIGALVLSAIGLVWACNANAGELGFGWQEQEYPFPLTYQLDTGGETIAEMPAGSQYVLANVPDGCQARAYELVAVGHLPDGTVLRSGPSPPVTSMARPVINGTVFSGTGVYRIEGDNFSPETTVTINGILVEDLIVTCTVLTFTAPAGTPTTVLVNSSGLLVTWTLPAPLAPNNLEVS